MKRFKDYISEEVLPTAEVHDGSIDIEKPEVRAQINNTLVAVTAQPAVTPYVVLQRIMKALAYFHIILPKKTFMGGASGVEVYEVHQFGHRMGMTNSGEFVSHVPEKFYLFIHYSTMSPIGVTYAKPIVGGMYRVDARLVDADGLEKLMDMARAHGALQEASDDKATMSQRLAGREDMHTALGDCDCSQGDSPSTKSAVSTMMRKSDKKLASGSIEEAMTRKQKDMVVRRFMSHDPDAGERILKMGKKEREEKKSFASAKKEIKRLKEEEQVDEASYEKLDKYVRKAHVSGTGAAARGEIAMHRGQKTRLHRANKTGEKREQGINLALDKMAGRALVPAKRKEKMEEEYEKVEAGVKKRPGETHTLHRRNPGHKTEYHTITTDRDGRKSVKTGSPKYIKKHWDKLEEEQLDELHGKGSLEKIRSYHQGEANKLSQGGRKQEKRMGALGRLHRDSEDREDAIKHHMGKAKKARGLMSKLAMREDTLDEAMGSIKKTYAMRKMKKKVNTQVKQGLGIGKERTNTVLVTNKGDTKAAGGGGVHRIPKDKYDPTKHNLASE